MTSVRRLLTPTDAPWFDVHEDADGFFNPWTERQIVGPLQVGRWMLSPNPMRGQKRAARPPEVAPRAASLRTSLSEGARVQWLGHASALVEIDGEAVVIDPVLGRVNRLVPRLQPAPLAADDLPRLSAIVLTHGHYDHLDGASVAALVARHPEAVVVVPRGLEGSLPRGARRVVPLDWWEAVSVGAVEVVLVPAQHWHRRSVLDTNRALWGGVVVQGTRSVYHAGDTGYFGGFAAIGRQFPELDLAILPLGAYEPRWFMARQHMAPEDSVRALSDLGAKRALGMHWGTFDLTDEPCDHGARHLLPAALDGAGIAPDRFVVVAPGGAVDLRTGEVAARV